MTEASMIYDIKIRIAYKYKVASASSRHLVRLFPKEIPGEQHVIDKDITIKPNPDERSMFTDFFGNETHDILNRASHKQLDITANCRVERLAPLRTEAPITLPDILSAMQAKPSLAPDSPVHFLGRTPRVRPSKLFETYAREHMGTDPSVPAIVRSIGMALHRDMTFDPDATQVDTPLEEAFDKRHGVCQDFSHIMIACLRSIGIPSGYVSGYLRTLPPPGKPRLEGADAMHAWIRAWCGPQNGWIGYDPTNAQTIGSDHIIAAHGRDYADVSPVRGVLRTSGDQSSVQQVDVREISS